METMDKIFYGVLIIGIFTGIFGLTIGQFYTLGTSTQNINNIISYSYSSQTFPFTFHQLVLYQQQASTSTSLVYIGWINGNFTAPKNITNCVIITSGFNLVSYKCG